MFIFSQYINEITIKFQCKCFKGKVVRVDGFRWKFKVVYKDFWHRIDSVRDEFFPIIMWSFQYLTKCPILKISYSTLSNLSRN